MNSTAALGRALQFIAWITALAAVSALCGATYFHFARGPTAFDRQAWLAGEQAGFSQDAPRLRMADGLIQDGRLIGMPRSQVDSLLGPQTDTSYFRPEYTYVYWLGVERGFFGIDSEWLVLKMGTGDRVSQARVVRD